MFIECPCKFDLKVKVVDEIESIVTIVEYFNMNHTGNAIGRNISFEKRREFFQ